MSSIGDKENKMSSILPQDQPDAPGEIWENSNTIRDSLESLQSMVAQLNDDLSDVMVPLDDDQSAHAVEYSSRTELGIYLEESSRMIVGLIDSVEKIIARLAI